MPLRFGSVGLFCSLVAIAFAANYASDNEAPSGSLRGPASIATMVKEDRLGPLLTTPVLKHTEKVRGPLSVKLEMLGPKPTNIGDVFVLRGIIASRRTLTATNYTWTVPPGVELVNGQLSGTLNNVDATQPTYVELTLRKVSPDNAQVHLMASSVLGQSRFGDSSQYNTDLQEMLNAKKAVLSGGNSDKPADLKIFH